jgi:D-alanine-D-alanine ligase
MIDQQLKTPVAIKSDPRRETVLKRAVFQYDFRSLPRYIETLYPSLRIAVVYGGNKDKDGSVIFKTVHTRSWKSYETVARDIQNALQEIGFRQVYLMPDDMTLPQRLKDERIHLVWLNTGGVQGYNPMSHSPTMLEMLGIPYVGHDPLYSTLLDNKHSFKRQLQALGIKTAPFITWHPSQGSLTPATSPGFLSAFGDYAGPFIVKPVSGRASLLVEMVNTLEELPSVAQKIYDATSITVLVETYLPGREFCVAVCGGVSHINGAFSKTSRPFALSPVERLFESGETIVTSMDHKAITTEGSRLLDHSEWELKQELRGLAEKIYWDLNLQSLIRIDVRADSEGVLHVLEANPKPDLKKPTADVTSLVMIGWQEYGGNYNDLILGLLADRLDYLFVYNRGVALPITNLLM